MNEPSQRWQALLGYLVDVYRFANLRFTNPHSYMKFLRLDNLRRKTNADVCIESGTYLGVTAFRCARVFQKVYTVELHPNLADLAAKFLKQKQNVQVTCGDAVAKIPLIFEQNRFSGAVVFLDGHYTGNRTARGDIPEPAIDELAMLERYKSRIAAIVIDDFRNFGVEEGFPSKSQLLQTVESSFPDFNLSVEMDQVCVVRS